MKQTQLLEQNKIVRDENMNNNLHLIVLRTKIAQKKEDTDRLEIKQQENSYRVYVAEIYRGRKGQDSKMKISLNVQIRMNHFSRNSCYNSLSLRQ